MKQEDGNFVFENVPMREGKDGYLGLLFRGYQAFQTVMTDPSYSDTDIRVMHLTKLMITSVSDKKIRNVIWKYLAEEIPKRVREEEKLKSLSNKEISQIKFDVCMECISLIMEFVDDFVGISHNLTVGDCGIQEINEEEEIILENVEDYETYLEKIP